MRTVALLLGLLLIASLANAQLNPPTGLSAVHDGNGQVVLNWNAPNVLGATSWQDLVAWPEDAETREDWVEPDFAQVRAQWEELQNQGNELDDFQFYFLYRNGHQVAIVYDHHYVDTLPQEGVYIYTVTAFYDLGESDHSNEASAVWYDQVSFPIDEDFNDGVMPDGWIVESTVASHTWIISDNHNLFGTPYALLDSDAAGNNPHPHLQERLLMPPFDFSETTFVELGYSSSFVNYIDEHGYVQYRIANGDWVTIDDYNEDSEDLDVVRDLTLELAGEPDADISFYYDDFGYWGYYWGIDDVSVYREEVSQDPATLDLIGMATQVPATGGVVGYDLSFVSTLPNTVQDVKYWATITLPNGSETDIVAYSTFTHTPFIELFYQALQQEVPGTAPAGMYSYNGFMGLSLNNPILTDSFNFTKASPQNADEVGEFVFDPSEWELHGLEEQIASTGEATAAPLPSEYALDSAWPNPFNAMTTLSLRLPETSNVQVAVYNVMGREVATLLNGAVDAGNHTLTFDASDLASGVYFVRATVPGQLNAVQKLVLMK